MAALYTVNNEADASQQNLSTSYKTLIGVNAATASLRRGRCWRWSFGADGAPNATDCAIIWDVARMTAAGTGTAFTPTPPDGTSVAADFVATINYTAEPTVTSSSTMHAFAINQRASQMWQAYDKDDCLVWPATNLAGLVFRAKSATYASPAVSTVTCEDI